MPPRASRKRRRVPKLLFSAKHGLGWHVQYRDPSTGKPKRHRFGIADRAMVAQAKAAYHAWVAHHLTDEHEPAPVSPLPSPAPAQQATASKPAVLAGSLVEIASGLLELERSRVRKEDAPRRRDTIEPSVFTDRTKHIRDFLAFLNKRHGQGAVARMRLADLEMGDVEEYNRSLVALDYSESQVAKRMQIVKAIIDRAGRPEHGQQLLPWNWESRDVAHGRPTELRRLPSVAQMERLLAAADLRGRLLIWLGIGLGFGQRDVSAIRVGQIAEHAYDLRRSKTGIERYGETPPRVWSLVSAFIVAATRPVGEHLMITRTGKPLVHGRSDAVTQWWTKLRAEVGESDETLGEFYTLRHLGATEYGARPGCSLSLVRRWLGHAAASTLADVYMKPVSPEYADIVQWTRIELQRNEPT